MNKKQYNLLSGGLIVVGVVWVFGSIFSMGDGRLKFFEDTKWIGYTAVYGNLILQVFFGKKFRDESGKND